MDPIVPEREIGDAVDLRRIDGPRQCLPVDSAGPGAPPDEVPASPLVRRLEAADGDPQADLLDDAEKDTAVLHSRLAHAHRAGRVGADAVRGGSRHDVIAEQTP